MANRMTRWIPAVVAVGVVTAGAIAVPLAANASAPLSTRSAKQVIAMIAASKVSALSGTIQQTSDLGLPSIPTTGSSSSSSSSSIMDLLTGTHNARIYLDGPTKQRVQVLDSLAERDVIHNGSTVWVYDSKKHTADETVLGSSPKRIHPGARVGVTSPSDLATRLLTQLRSSSVVSVGGDVGVAGRSAYDLVLKPKASDTLLGSVSIAVDSVTGLPLRVDVTARGASSPAVRVGFTDLTLGKPAASVFAFSPPANTSVTKHDASKSSGAKHEGSATTQGKTPNGKAHDKKVGTTVAGTGWDAVVTITAKDSKKVLASLTGNPLYGQLSTAVSGGRAISTTLVTILVTDDGRVLVGSVPLSRLQSVAQA